MPSSERPPAPTRRRRRRAAALAAALALLAGCSGGGTDDPGGTASPPDRAAAGDARDLAGVCPAKVVVQAAWFPTADLATPFQLFAADWSIDAARKRVSGSLVSAGRDPGVDLEFRSARRCCTRTPR